MGEITVGSICRTNLSQPGGLVRVLSIEPYSEGSNKMHATIEHIEAHPYGYAAGTIGGYMVDDLVLVDDDEPDSWDDDLEDRDRTCPYCHGIGGDPWNDGITPCEHCDGEGYQYWL